MELASLLFFVVELTFWFAPLEIRLASFHSYPYAPTKNKENKENQKEGVSKISKISKISTKSQHITSISPVVILEYRYSVILVVLLLILKEYQNTCLHVDLSFCWCYYQYQVYEESENGGPPL